MRVVTTVEEARRLLRGLPRPLGLVPTMGFLHEGHLSLVRRARAESATVAASIFVNPAQFLPTEDLSTYPRDEARDLALLEAERVDVVFAPPVEVVYPAGFDTYVTVGALTERLEGAARPGHFRGVATVVAKLFNIVQPDVAYFGQKDAQQALVIQKMVRDLDMPLKIAVLPTIREPDGLALSSRNVYLAPAERQAALSISRGLLRAEALFRDGERDAERLRDTVAESIRSEPLMQLEYVSLADPRTLAEARGPIESGLISLAARVGRTRLIDNVVLGAPTNT